MSTWTKSDSCGRPLPNTFRFARQLVAIALLAVPASARELPIRLFTVADGLNDQNLNRLVLDSHDLLWACTSSGISRFDGARFQSFDVPNVSSPSNINDLLEVGDGYFWLATNGSGVIRFPLSARGRPIDTFRVSSELTTNRVNRLFRGPDGAIWAGTDGGLFRMTVGGDGTPTFTRVPLHLRAHPDATVQVWSMAWDGEGSLWFGTRFGLLRMLPGGGLISYPVGTGFETDHVFSLLYTAADGLLWIGHQSGLTIFRPPPAASYGTAPSGETRESTEIVRTSGGRRSIAGADRALPHERGEAFHFEVSPAGVLPRVNTVVRGRSGTVYAIGTNAVAVYSDSRFALLDDQRFHSRMGPAVEDREGNLWIATQSGALRLAREGFTTFGPSDGVGPLVSRVFVSRAGDPIALSEGWRLSRFDGERFHTVRVNIPAAAQLAGRPSEHAVIEDREGDWWFATGAGLLRFSHARRIDDLATIVPRWYTTRDGLAQNDIRMLFEASHGGIWIASLIPGRDVLTRWDRASGEFRRYSDADGLQPFNSPTSFYEDPRGVLWVTFRDGGIARYEGGRFRMLGEADGLPPGGIGITLVDHAGRLWCTNSRVGLYHLDDLTAPRLQPIFVATAERPREQQALRLAEDAFGSMYLMMRNGIRRLDEGTGANAAVWRVSARYGTDAGLTSGVLGSVSRDRQGRLWFSSLEGVSYFEPRPRQPSSPPQVRIEGMRIAGVEHLQAPVGEQRVAGFELTPGQSQLEIGFFGISFATGDTLSFEHRLMGASEEWSVPSPSRTVLFSNLAPGHYDFEVRAVSTDGQRSPETAHAVFTVRPPIWRRWWFLALSGLVVSSALVGFVRYRSAHKREIDRAREERLAELEQVRRRIAADLHDEIGSSLTQISILSEVARRQGAQVVPELGEPLSMIAASSRELVDAMSDIVWAINPAKDHLADLTQRMRRLAADTFSASSARVRIELPPADRELKLGANVRREVFLIFKESLNNIVKHSACSEVAIALAVEDSVLRLDVRDNGKGFDPLAPVDGHGLASLRSRASALGGTMTVVSAPGAGTAITLVLPIPT
jgi:signal transduction histidine kinase/ligand-binding sensor domain-containing protein